ncbi:MAG TPA: hypothetical protein VGI82_13495 [Chitinophagaceae bacterium]
MKKKITTALLKCLPTQRFSAFILVAKRLKLPLWIHIVKPAVIKKTGKTRFSDKNMIKVKRCRQILLSFLQLLYASAAGKTKDIIIIGSSQYPI